MIYCNIKLHKMREIRFYEASYDMTQNETK